MKKASTKYEPVYMNKFVANIKSASLNVKEAKLLNETIKLLDYGENLCIGFEQYVIKNKIQPLTILERLKKDKAILTIELIINDKADKVLRKVNFSECELQSIIGLQSFSLDGPQIARPISVGFSYKKIKIS